MASGVSVLVQYQTCTTFLGKNLTNTAIIMKNDKHLVVRIASGAGVCLSGEIPAAAVCSSQASAGTLYSIVLCVVIR